MKNFMRFTLSSLAMLFTSALFSSQLFAQGVGEIWSKNIEMICPVSGNLGYDYIDKEKVIVSGSQKIVIPVVNDGDGLRITDVTNPRSIVKEAVRIKMFKTGSTEFLSFRNQAIWKDATSGSAPHGHTFSIVEVENIDDATISVSPAVKARYLIFDVTRAMETVTTTKTIIIDNPNSRAAHLEGVTGTTFNDVYVGFIKSDHSPVSHSLTMESELGMLMISSLGGNLNRVDLQQISTIVSPLVSNSTTFEQPTWINSGGSSITTDPTVDPDPNNTNADAVPHETVGEKIDGNTIRLYIALTGDINNAAKGGVVIEDVNLTTAGVTQYTQFGTNEKIWRYDADRTSAGKKLSGIPGIDWKIANTHTALPKKYGGNTYILTTNELASPFATRTLDASDATNQTGIPQTTLSTETNPVLGTDTYTGLLAGRSYDGTHFDYRLSGNFLRIWKYNTTTLSIEGTDHGNSSDDGPLGLYDVPEQSVTDRNTVPEQFGSILQVSAMEATHANAASGSSDRQRGVNTMHHIHSIDNDPDIYMSGYTAGARVISIENFPSNPVIKEKAYFDFYPTLTFDWSTANTGFTESNNYFCFNSGAGNTSGSNGFYNNFVSFGLPNYFMGISSMKSDYSRTGLESDEKFIYAAGVGEGKVGTETADRNYLHGGGFFILRYFDDKLGGTITGYTGTNTTNNRSYREVNLQGDFTVERNTTVASGATVNLLKNTNLNARNITNPSECLIIDGTVDIQTLTDGGRGTINVPILVRSGGQLVVSPGAVIDFTKNITVNPGGTFRIEHGAKVALPGWGLYTSVKCDGSFLVYGTENSRVRVTGTLDASDRTKTIGNNAFRMTGVGSIYPPYAFIQIENADVENVWIDARNIYGYYPSNHSNMFLNSNFSANYGASNNAIPRTLVSIQGVRRILRSGAPVLKVENCYFKDRYGFRTDKNYKVKGLSIEGIAKCYVEDTHFEYLYEGLNASKVSLFANSNILHDCTLGIHCQSTSSRLCTNSATDVVIAYVGENTGNTSLYHNNFLRNGVGAEALSSNMHELRGNSFDTYCTALFGWGTTLTLRDNVDILGNPNELGENKFIVTGTPCTLGLNVIDIDYEMNSKLIIPCGYNLFTKFSKWHVWGDNTVPVFDPSSNEWRDVNNTFNVRTNLNVAGNPLNASLTLQPPNQCGTLTPTTYCPVSICMNRGGIYETAVYDSMASTVYQDSAWWRTTNTSSPIECRMLALHDYYELIKAQDSDYYYNLAVSKFDSIYNNTYDSSSIRSLALLLKGDVKERMDSLSQAVSAYSNIVQNFQYRADSIPAAWRIHYLSAIQDTVNSDSLVSLYDTRVLNDIKRITFHPSESYKINTDSPTKPESDILELEQNKPNPWRDETEISFTVPYSGNAHLGVLDVLGNEVVVLLDGDCKAGKNQVMFKQKDLPNGVYFYRLQYGNSVLTKKMQKTH